MVELLLRLTLSAAAGGIVGLERELRGHVAGVRTHALVAVGAALFSLAGIEGAVGSFADPTRLAAQVVSGLGFVGAGAILRDRGGVRGLTTASTIWISGSLGVVSAVGNVTLVVAGMSLVVIILSSRRLLRWMLPSRNPTAELCIELEYELGHGTIGPLVRVAADTDSAILQLTMVDTFAVNPALRTARMTLRSPLNAVSLVTDTITAIETRAEIRRVHFEPRDATED
jgi:putative Mg2+ transporter-C (MgtC) family protein